MPRRKFEQMPFENDGGLDFPKRKKAKECDPKPRQTMKQKQRSWVLNGLKHLRAPAATLQNFIPWMFLLSGITPSTMEINLLVTFNHFHLYPVNEAIKNGEPS